MIHPTAIVHKNAQIHDSAEIGPYAIIDEHVTLGADCVVEAARAPHRPNNDQQRQPFPHRLCHRRRTPGREVRRRTNPTHHRRRQHLPRTRHHSPIQHARGGHADLLGKHVHGQQPRRPQRDRRQPGDPRQRRARRRPRDHWRRRVPLRQRCRAPVLPRRLDGDDAGLLRREPRLAAVHHRSRHQRHVRPQQRRPQARRFFQ